MGLDAALTIVHIQAKLGQENLSRNQMAPPSRNCWAMGWQVVVLTTTPGWQKNGLLEIAYITIKSYYPLTLSSLGSPLSSSSTTTANCFRNSRHAVDEDDLKWVNNWRELLPCIGEIVSWKFSFWNPRYEETKSVFRDVKWCFNASRGLKGLMC